MAIVTFRIELPDTALRNLLQAVRTWENDEDEIELSMAVEQSTYSRHEIEQMLSELDPPMAPIFTLVPPHREVH